MIWVRKTPLREFAWLSLRLGAISKTSAAPAARRVKELDREVKELRRANELLKLASAFFAQAELDRRFKP
jgi:transposase-like protein